MINGALVQQDHQECYALFSFGHLNRFDVQDLI